MSARGWWNKELVSCGFPFVVIWGDAGPEAPAQPSACYLQPDTLPALLLTASACPDVTCEELFGTKNGS